MLNKILFVLMTSLLVQAATIEGSWKVKSLHCKSGAPVAAPIEQLFKTVLMTFQNGQLIRTMNLMPNCTITGVGAYVLNGAILEVGPVKSTKSQTCPTGINVSDTPAAKIPVSFQQNGLVLATPPTGACPTLDDTLLMVFELKTSRR